MILKDALLAVPARLRRPAMLALILGSLGFFSFTTLATARLLRHLPEPPIVLLSLPLFLLAMVVSEFWFFLATPLPWQWTGDDRSLASLPRGLIQSAVFNLVCTALRLSLLLPAVRTTTGSPLQGLLLGTLVATGAGYGIALWEKWRLERQEALRRTEEARWQLLKAQMSPHVLLNSLNGLAELVREDPAAATRGMQDLAEVYRQLLAMGEAPRLPLKEERHLLERYLAVEQLRLGEQLRVEWAWNPAVDACAAIPLLLQPLVENAIKHGAAADPAGGTLRIEAAREGRILHLTVANTGSGRSAPSTGVGLRNLKARLELAYHGQATFRLEREKPWTRAELRIPIEETP